MNELAADVMHKNVYTVDPHLKLADLEREFMEKKVSVFPVLDHSKLVGIVSRSDIVRQLSVEQSLSEMISDYHGDATGVHVDSAESLHEIATRVGRRLEDLQVKDVMIRRPITVKPDDTVQQVAKVMVASKIHRVLVTDQGQLAGIISTLDLVKLIAEQKP